MGKDWVVWLGCVLLFASGAVWAGIQLPISFFIVKDIHDLVEMVAAAGTFGAAVYGLSTWRAQLHASSDLELAKRLAVELMKYKITAVEAFHSARFVFNQSPNGPDSLPESLLNSFAPEMAKRLDHRKEVKANLLAVIMEAKAIWGTDFGVGFDPLLNFVEHCNNTVQAFLDSRGDGSHGLAKLASLKVIMSKEEMFTQNGWGNNHEGKAMALVSGITADIELTIQRKMFR